MINKKVNYGITNQDYFTNNSKGFDEPYVIKISNLNIKVKIYSHNLRASKIAKIENEIKETVNNFKNSFGLEYNGSEQIFKIYIFDDKDDYTYLGKSENFNYGLGDEGGKCFYRGKPDVFAEIYVYQQGDVYNLQHELVHGLTYLATEGKSLPTVLMEGIADYFEHYSDHKFNSQSSSIDKTKDINLNLHDILKLEYSINSEQNSLVYKTGHALVMYLQEKEPSLLKDYMYALRVGESQNFLHKIIQNNEDFKSWLISNNTEVAMKDINALQVTKGEFIVTKKEIVDGKIKDVSYYEANIDKISGENVGIFSSTEHISYYNNARAINRATNDYLDVSKEYNFLKVIKTTEGQYQLTYCDKQGNDYKDTQEYKMQAFRILLNYDEKIKSVVEEFHRMNKQRDETGQEDIKYRLVCEKFNQLKYKVINEIENYPQVVKVLKELTIINPNLIGNIALQEGKVFSIKALGKGIAGALSIYDGNIKLGELLSEVGFFKQVEGQIKGTFFFEDILHNLNAQYDRVAYITITKENGHYKASFIDGKKVESDEYFNESHLHENELLSPSINHIKEEDLDSLLLQNTKILNHKDSEFAQYSTEQRKSGTIVEKGKLLDDKGTDRTDDDVYEAVIKQGLHAFKNIGFYISEEIKDAKGKTFNDSQLFIHDHGKNIRFQLPSSITHLKLVQKDGEYKLVPSTKNGNEHPEDMLNISDDYRYIDPIFAHEYEKRDYSHKHVNIGLINLGKYKLGTLFTIKYDPNDYNILRNSNDEIVRMNGNAYFTKVKLFHNDEEIGMLSNNFHNFKDKIFFSADYNYSYSDFLASISPQVEIKDMQDGSKKITFDQSRGDVGDTHKGYTDHQRIFVKEKQDKSEVQADSEDNTIDVITQTTSDTASVTIKAASDILSSKWSGTQDKQTINDKETEIPLNAKIKRSSEIDDMKMQNDQPSQIVTKEKELVTLKDTILKIEKSYDQDSQEKHKAYITIDYHDIKSLYDKAEGEEKNSVLEFWHKLHKSKYKIGVLPEEKYYFEKGKFIIYDNQKYVVLSEDKIFIKIMKLDDNYSLVISNEKGNIINSISKIDNLNYELLSDSGHFSLETQNSIQLEDQHYEYDLYLANGLEGKIFNSTNEHYYSLI